MAESWPAEGLPLAEALWRIEPDPQVMDLGIFGSMVAAPTLRRNRVRRLCALVTEGQYKCAGRRGSLVAEPQDIPASALSRLDFDLADRSEVRERVPDGQRWYDVSRLCAARARASGKARVHIRRSARPARRPSLT
jgi:hypothetical protein